MEYCTYSSQHERYKTQWKERRWGKKEMSSSPTVIAMFHTCKWVICLSYAYTLFPRVPAHHCLPGIIQKCSHELSFIFSCLFQAFPLAKVGDLSKIPTLFWHSPARVLSQGFLLPSKTMSWGWRHAWHWGYKHLLLLQRTGVWFQAPTMGIYNSLKLQLQESNTLFLPQQAYLNPHAHTHMHKIKRNFKN